MIVKRREIERERERSATIHEQQKSQKKKKKGRKECKKKRKGRRMKRKWKWKLNWSQVSHHAFVMVINQQVGPEPTLLVLHWPVFALKPTILALPLHCICIIFDRPGGLGESSHHLSLLLASFATLQWNSATGLQRAIKPFDRQRKGYFVLWSMSTGNWCVYRVHLQKKKN